MKNNKLQKLEYVLVEEMLTAADKANWAVRAGRVDASASKNMKQM